ncbi:MAG: DUF1385 domain-containing protein [Firmicutes bacterium]|nr:DUF1385 domain-containing protein [Bacillota bacterium]
MDFSKIFIKDANPTKMGGQAVMEGIMMKGSDRTAIAVRRPDGTINIKEEPAKPRSKWTKVPIIRGVVTFVDSLVTGTRTLMYSAQVLEESLPEEELEEPTRFEKWLSEHFSEKGVFNFLLYSSVVVALAVSLGIFVLLPTWVVGLSGHVIHNAIVLNLIEGVLRIIMFILYVAIISQMNDIKRVFQFHGAEHQTIHCYENGLELKPENCMQFETLHPRCGTSFLMFVMIISLLLFSFLGWPNVWIRLLSRIILIPVVAGLSYEVLKWAGNSESMAVKILSVPGLLMQRLTTKVPDESQLEVAIVAVKACLSEEPPQERIYDVDSQGNRIDREKLQENASDSEADNTQKSQTVHDENNSGEPEAKAEIQENRNESRKSGESVNDKAVKLSKDSEE